MRPHRSLWRDGAHPVRPRREAAVRTRLGLKVRLGILGPQDVINVDGMAVTSAVQTWFDLARHQPLIEAVAAVDWVLHRRLVSRSELSVADVGANVRIGLQPRCWLSSSSRTRAGVSGSCVTATPPKASATAFTTAGGAAIVPPSPTPR